MDMKSTIYCFHARTYILLPVNRPASIGLSPLAIRKSSLKNDPAYRKTHPIHQRQGISVRRMGCVVNCGVFFRVISAPVPAGRPGLPFHRAASVPAARERSRALPARRGGTKPERREQRRQRPGLRRIHRPGMLSHRQRAGTCRCKSPGCRTGGRGAPASFRWLRSSGTR